jgi:hypothetical protein
MVLSGAWLVRGREWCLVRVGYTENVLVTVAVWIGLDYSIDVFGDVWLLEISLVLLLRCSGCKRGLIEQDMLANVSSN